MITPYVKTFPVPGGYEAEVWIDIPTEPLPLSLHTTKPAQRESTVERRATDWVESTTGRETLALELNLLAPETVV